MTVTYPEHEGVHYVQWKAKPERTNQARRGNAIGTKDTGIEGETQKSTLSENAFSPDDLSKATIRRHRELVINQADEKAEGLSRDEVEANLDLATIISQLELAKLKKESEAVRTGKIPLTKSQVKSLSKKGPEAIRAELREMENDAE